MTARIVAEAHGSVGWREMVGFRHRLLRAPLGLRFSDAELAAEAGQLHLALRREDRLLGTVLLVPPGRAGGPAKLRQMATDPDCRGEGLGTALVRRAEQEALRFRAGSVRLAARESAVGFYRRLGYCPEGEPFVEVTLPHRWMSRFLTG